MDYATEEWKPIPGYEGLYDVSTHGKIRSHDRLVTRKSGKQVLWRGRTLKPNKGTKGHYRVNLFRDGTPEMVYIHQVVARAFVPNPQELPLVRHWDDVKENNHVGNLLWGTHSDNRQDALRNGARFGPRLEDRTHCSRGHEYNETNTYWAARSGRKYRVCRTCQRNWWRNSNGKSLRDPLYSRRSNEEKEKNND